MSIEAPKQIWLDFRDSPVSGKWRVYTAENPFAETGYIRSDLSDAAIEQARAEVWEEAIGVVKQMQDDYLATAAALNTDGTDPFTHNVGVAMEIIEQLEHAREGK